MNNRQPTAGTGAPNKTVEPLDRYLELQQRRQYRPSDSLQQRRALRVASDRADRGPARARRRSGARPRCAAGPTRRTARRTGRAGPARCSRRRVALQMNTSRSSSWRYCPVRVLRSTQPSIAALIRDLFEGPTGATLRPGRQRPARGGRLLDLWGAGQHRVLGALDHGLAPNRRAAWLGEADGQSPMRISVSSTSACRSPCRTPAGDRGAVERVQILDGEPVRTPRHAGVPAGHAGVVEHDVVVGGCGRSS